MKAARSPRATLLAINGGSSSIRFAWYVAGRPLRRLLDGKVERIGSKGANLTFRDEAGKTQLGPRLTGSDHRTVGKSLLAWLEAQPNFASIKAVGHRIVQGLRHSAPERVTPKLLADLRRITSYDPEHLPRELELIEAVRQRHPRLPQIACFDTAFHRTLPPLARLLPLPRRYAAKGVERYGFHGLSYAPRRARPGDSRAPRQWRQPGRRMAGPEHRHQHGLHAGGRPGHEHADGRSGSRRGLLPGAHRTPDRGAISAPGEPRVGPAGRFRNELRYARPARAGARRDRRGRRGPRAAEAVGLFCYQAKKWIGSYAAVLGGLDTLVFAGGIGENAPPVRARICAGLGFLGLRLDAERNARSAPLISTAASRVRVRVIRTDEELMIGRSVARLLKL